MMGQVANVSQCSTNTKGASEFCTFLSFVGGGDTCVQRCVDTGKPAEAWSSCSEHQKHALPSLALEIRLTLDVLVPQQRLALLI